MRDAEAITISTRMRFGPQDASTRREVRTRAAGNARTTSADHAWIRVSIVHEIGADTPDQRFHDQPLPNPFLHFLFNLPVECLFYHI